MVFISIKRWRGSTPAWNSWRHLEETEHLVPADYLWTWGCQIEAIGDQWARIHLPSLVPLVIAVHPENWPKCQFWPLVIIGGAEKQTARARMIKLTRRNRDAANTQMVNPEPPSSAIMRVGWNERETMLQSTADNKKILWYYVNRVHRRIHMNWILVLNLPQVQFQRMSSSSRLVESKPLGLGGNLNLTSQMLSTSLHVQLSGHYSRAHCWS